MSGFTHLFDPDRGQRQSPEPERLAGLGACVGVTMNPDQIRFGARSDFGKYAEHIRFQPNLEIGLGDNRTIFAVNFEANYRFQS